MTEQYTIESLHYAINDLDCRMSTYTLYKIWENGQLEIAPGLYTRQDFENAINDIRAGSGENTKYDSARQILIEMLTSKQLYVAGTCYTIWELYNAIKAQDLELVKTILR